MSKETMIDKKLFEKYNKETVLELSDRSKGTTPAYLIDFIVLVFLTPIYNELPGFTIALGISFIILTLIKLYSGNKIIEKYDDNPKFWYGFFLFHSFAGAVLLATFIVGALTVFKVNAYTLLFLLLVGGMPAGATSSMAPRFKVAFIFKFLLMGPVVIWCLIDGTKISLSLGGLFAFYFIMLVVITKKNTRWYWVGVAQQDQIKKQTSKLQKIFQSIGKRSNYLETSASDLAGFSHEMNKSVDFLSERTGKINSESDYMTGNTKSVSDTMDNTTSNINAIAAALEQMTATVQEISKNTHSANLTASSATEKAREAASNVIELQNGANAIGEITEMISNIADQTNLLALNATIEAARAGEAGKGFAVVANEIKELASQAAQSTARINEKIEEMQQSTRKTSDSIHEILDIVTESNEMISTIAAAVEEQSSTAKEISENTDMASGGVQEVNDKIHENSQRISNINQELNEITNSISEIGNNSKLIDESAESLKEQAVKLNHLAAE